MRPSIVLIATILVAACSTSPAATTPSSATVTPSSIGTPRPGLTRIPSPGAQSSSPIALPTAPSPIVDLAQVFHPLVPSWRPTGPTLLTATVEDFKSTLVAIPVTKSGLAAPPTKIMEFLGAWGIRSDGGAIAVEIGTAAGMRVAVADLLSGKTRWATEAQVGVTPSAPVWSNDGSTIFYGSVGSTPPAYSGTVYRVGPNGSDQAAIATLARFGGLDGITPDGRSLIWSRIQAGGSVDLLDVASATDHHLEDVARIASIRTKQPRMLLAVGGCCAGYPGGDLVLWDDVALTSRIVAAQAGAVRWGTATWDPTGTRLVAARFDDVDRYQGTLVRLDPETGASQQIPGAPRGAPLAWTDEGLVVLKVPGGPAFDVTLVSPDTGSTATLFSGPNIYRVIMVRP